MFIVLNEEDARCAVLKACAKFEGAAPIWGCEKGN